MTTDTTQRLSKSLAQLEDAQTDAEMLLASIFIRAFQAQYRAEKWTAEGFLGKPYSEVSA
jgi:hypothetical protein